MTRYLAALPMLGVCVLLGCDAGDDGSGNARPTSTATAITTATAPPVFTATQAPTSPVPSSPTPVRTATGIPTGTVTATVTATPIMQTPTTPTPDPLGPEVTFFGVARADDVVQETNRFDELGRPIYERLLGQGFSLIIEGGRGMGSREPGIEAFEEDGTAPDLQLLVSQPLGNGSPEVCDYDIFDPSVTGGIPATTPLAFSDDPSVVGAMNDLGCRVNDGTGIPRARVTGDNACTQMNGEFDFVNSISRVQFCLPVAKAWAFPPGDTVVAVRVRNQVGIVSASKEIVIRVLRNDPDVCAGLGERRFTIARPESMLLSTAGEGDVSIDPWLEGPLNICAGAQRVDGSYSLTLVEDAFFAFTAADDSVFCVRLSARESSGSIDCDGGSAHDVVASQELPDAPIVTSGLGVDAGPGAATLNTRVSIVGLPAGSTAADCGSQPPTDGGFSTSLTTAQALGELIDGDQELSLAAIGTNFDCDRWTETDSPGTFVLAFPVPGTIAGDTVNALVLTD